jgi:hypothetical protein
VSHDLLAFLPSGVKATLNEARELFVVTGEAMTTAALGPVADFLTALRERYPPFDEVDPDDDDSPWASEHAVVADNAVSLTLSSDHLDAIEDVVALARAYGLACYDPQADAFVRVRRSARPPGERRALLGSACEALHAALVPLGLAAAPHSMQFSLPHTAHGVQCVVEFTTGRAHRTDVALSIDLDVLLALHVSPVTDLLRRWGCPMPDSYTALGDFEDLLPPEREKPADTLTFTPVEGQPGVWSFHDAWPEVPGRFRFASDQDPHVAAGRAAAALAQVLPYLRALDSPADVCREVAAKRLATYGPLRRVALLIVCGHIDRALEWLRDMEKHPDKDNPADQRYVTNALREVNG